MYLSPRRLVGSRVSRLPGMLDPEINIKQCSSGCLHYVTSTDNTITTIYSI